MATKAGRPTTIKGAADTLVPVLFEFPGSLVPAARQVSLLGPFMALSEPLTQHRRAQMQKQHFVLAGPSRLLSKLLQITHLTEAIPLFPNVDAALASCLRPAESHSAALANAHV